MPEQNASGQSQVAGVSPDVREAWTTDTRPARRYRGCLRHSRFCNVVLLGLSAFCFTYMMADGQLVDTQLRASRCVHPQFRQEFPLDCNGLVVCFPTLVLIVTVLAFATLACMLWISAFLVHSNLSRAVDDITAGKLQDISTMLMIFTVLKVLFVSINAMHIGMTWYSELADTRVVGLVLVACDVVEIFITLSSWLRIFIARRLLEEEECRIVKMKRSRESQRLQQLPETYFGELKAEGQENCVICLVDFDEKSQVTRLACGHVFHSSCIKTWLSGKKCLCPYRCHTSPLALAEA